MPFQINRQKHYLDTQEESHFFQTASLQILHNLNKQEQSHKGPTVLRSLVYHEN